ncbi:hypothetical protein BDW66DRAFT_144789 [Aspergillus desertorum]
MSSSTPVEGASPHLANLAEPNLLADDVILGIYNGNCQTVFFQKFIKKDPYLGDLQLGASVLFKNQTLKAYWPLSPSANGKIRVMFEYRYLKRWKVHVDVPYSDVESRLPKAL